MEAPDAPETPPAESTDDAVGATHDSTHADGGHLTLDEARTALAAAREEADALRTALDSARASAEQEAAAAERELHKAHEQLKGEMAARQREQRQAHIAAQGAVREKAAAAENAKALGQRLDERDAELARGAQALAARDAELTAARDAQRLTTDELSAAQSAAKAQAAELSSTRHQCEQWCSVNERLVADIRTHEASLHEHEARATRDADALARMRAELDDAADAQLTLEAAVREQTEARVASDTRGEELTEALAATCAERDAARSQAASLERELTATRARLETQREALEDLDACKEQQSQLELANEQLELAVRQVSEQLGNALARELDIMRTLHSKRQLSMLPAHGGAAAAAEQHSQTSLPAVGGGRNKHHAEMRRLQRKATQFKTIAKQPMPARTGTFPAITQTNGGFPF